MLLTDLVFQSAMLPYVVAAVVGFVAHAVAAVPMFVFVMAVCASATGAKVQLKMSTAPKSRRRLTLRGNVDGRGRHFGGRTWKEPESSKAQPNLHPSPYAFSGPELAARLPSCDKGDEGDGRWAIREMGDEGDGRWR